MKRSHRHTIMDGRVVTFATDFNTQDSAFEPCCDALGPFEVSASRNAVVVHNAELRTAEDRLHFTNAMEMAWNEHKFLSSCDGRPDDNDRGEPREILP